MVTMHKFKEHYSEENLLLLYRLMFVTQFMVEHHSYAPH